VHWEFSMTFDSSNLTETAQGLYDSLKMVEKWVEEHGYKGYEPFDGLSSWFKSLTFGNLFLDRLLLQLIRQSPINLRPLLGIKALDSTIGRGYMAWGYCRMYQATGDRAYLNKISTCLNWLIENKSIGYREYSWGKHFDFASRSGYYKAFEPILIWTALIGQAFLEAYELLEDARYLEIADSLCAWIMTLPRNQTESGLCLGYHHQDTAATIHNANMVGAAVLARTAKHTGNQEFQALAKEAMHFSCSRQLPNGAWWYGEDPGNHWIDNFHTGYNLDALKCYLAYSDQPELAGTLKKGLAFYKTNFFDETGRPKYYHNRLYPIDSQCASQAVDTLANFSEIDQSCLPVACKVAFWVINNMQDRNGHFYYRIYPGGIKAKAPMLHWAQATMYKGLVNLFNAVNGHAV
jgi:hypothetical protein